MAGSLIDNVQDFFQGVLRELIRNGGVKAQPEQIKARKAVCDGCKYKGKVKVLPFLPKVDGCTDCGCDLMTKQGLILINKGEGELGAKTVLTGKMSGNLEKVTCQLGFWDEIDKEFV